VVLTGLALFLTLFVMSPVFEQIHLNAIAPYLDQKVSLDQALAAGEAPLRAFMLKQTRETDLELFLRLSRTENIQSPDDIPLTVLVSSFLTSELKTAFQIGFMIFIPFLVIDMVVAHQMQCAVYDQMRPVRTVTFSLFARFALQNLRTDHQIAQRLRLHTRQGHGRKRQHIGGIVLAAKLPVQAPAGWGRHQLHGYFAARRARSQCRTGPQRQRT
jgi:flagellar biosynthesis protein FliP